VISFEKSVHINKPAAEVFAFMSDLANNAKWQEGLVSSTKTSDGPMGVGTTFESVQKLMGKETKNEIQVTAYEPSKLFSAKSIGGPVQVEISTKFEEMGGGTHVTSTMNAEMGGFLKVAEGLAKGELEKSFERTFARLKEILEAS
jgi:carbon monoxide dehydrogenase subunit G